MYGARIFRGSLRLQQKYDSGGRCLMRGQNLSGLGQLLRILRSARARPSASVPLRDNFPVTNSHFDKWDL